LIKSIYFDVGNIIINEDILRFKFYEILWFNLRKYDQKWTFDYLMEMRENLVEKIGDPTPYLTIAREFLNSNDLYSFNYQIKYFTEKHKERYLRQIPGIGFVIRNLHRHFKLGIIATHSLFLMDLFKKYRLTLFFDVIITEDNRKEKESPRQYFLRALEKMKTEPGRALMIGDRIDKNILPAKEVGMRTILARFTTKAKGIFPQNSREKRFYKSLETHPPWRQRPRNRRELPTAIAESPEEILKIVEGMEFAPSTPESVEEVEPEISIWDIIKEMAAGEEEIKPREEL